MHIVEVLKDENKKLSIQDKIILIKDKGKNLSEFNPI